MHDGRQTQVPARLRAKLDNYGTLASGNCGGIRLAVEDLGLNQP